MGARITAVHSSGLKYQWLQLKIGALLSQPHRNGEFSSLRFEVIVVPQVLDDLGFLAVGSTSRDHQVTLHADGDAHMPCVIGIQIIAQDVCIRDSTWPTRPVVQDAIL